MGWGMCVCVIGVGAVWSDGEANYHRPCSMFEAFFKRLLFDSHGRNATTMH